MTKEIQMNLTTGDIVRNSKTGQASMIIAQNLNHSDLLSIEQLTPLEDWELYKSRLIITETEKRNMEEYHRKLDEQKH